MTRDPRPCFPDQRATLPRTHVHITPVTLSFPHPPRIPSRPYISPSASLSTRSHRQGKPKIKHQPIRRHQTTSTQNNACQSKARNPLSQSRGKWSDLQHQKIMTSKLSGKILSQMNDYENFFPPSLRHNSFIPPNNSSAGVHS